MSAVALLDAERIKLSTTRSPLWTAVAVAGLSLGLAAIQGSAAYGAAPLPPEKPALGVAVFGVPVLMVLAAMTVTGEYRSGMIRTTFMATPKRSRVLVAKAVVAALFSGAYTALMVIGAILAAHMAAPPLVGVESHLSLAAAETWRTVGAICPLRAAHRGAGSGGRSAAAACGRRRRSATDVAAGGRADSRESAKHRFRGRTISAVRQCVSVHPRAVAVSGLSTCRGVNSARWCTSRRSSRWCSRRRSSW